MRGFNYDTVYTEGIALLLAKPFSSNRIYRQALGRIGRFGMPCKRYVLDSVPAYDTKQHKDELHELIMDQEHKQKQATPTSIQVH